MATAISSQSAGIQPDDDSRQKQKQPLDMANSGNVSDKDRKIGHRRVDDTGGVSYKKVSTNHLMGSIQLGIGQAIGNLGNHEERDLLLQDFGTIETTQFPQKGSSQTMPHKFSEFTFRTYAPLAFRHFLKLFGIKRDDFLVSLCNQPMRELSNPGASGSVFYLTYDDEFILKTVQHKEAEFLQELLPGYYMNLNQNPHTLLPKFFGMYVYQCNQKNIRVIVMNNLLPSNIKMHLKFDLKGSRFKRKANKREREKSSPTFKDLDFEELLPEGLMLEAETYNALIATIRKDCRVLESFKIMDYSLLIGIHNIDLAAREQVENSSGVSPSKEQARKEAERKMQRYAHKQKLVNNSTPMESIQAQTEPIDEQDHLPPGGIPARNHKGERLLLYLGIIDILQSYRMRKKLEHAFKAIIHDGNEISVHNPSFYATRFLNFMGDDVFKKTPSPLKHSPSKRGKRDSIKKLTAEEASTSAGGNSSTEKNTTVPAAATSSDSPVVQPSTSEAASSAQQGNELGQLRGAAAIEAAIKSSKTEDDSENTNGENDSGAAQVNTLPNPPTSAASTASNSGGALGANFSFDYDKATAGETLNIPAVLWDRPAGSSKRVPPPVPPRSPRRPYDHVTSFANASEQAFRGNASQQRPDVVSGIIDEQIPTLSKVGSNRPRHKRQDQVQQLAYNHSRSSNEA